MFVCLSRWLTVPTLQVTLSVIEVGIQQQSSPCTLHTGSHYSSGLEKTDEVSRSWEKRPANARSPSEDHENVNSISCESLNEFQRKITQILYYTVLWRRTDYAVKVTGSTVQVDFACVLASSRSLRRCKWGSWGK